MKPIVLMYHCVFDKTQRETGFQNKTAFKYKISVINFEDQVKIISCYLDKNNLSKESVVFTFDDGGVSSYNLIMPILDKYHLKGIFFIATKFIGTSGFLSEMQIADINAKGHVVGSHSNSHPKKMIDLPHEELINEWTISCQILSDIINSDVSVASIPNGYISKRVTDAMQICGLTRIYTSEPTTKIKQLKKAVVIGRYAITNNMTTEQVLDIVQSKRRRAWIIFRNDILHITKILLGDRYQHIKEILS